MSKDKDLANNGMIVNTCGWVEGGGLNLIYNAIKTLEIDHVLVIGDDRLNSNLKKKFPNISIERIQKSGGVVARK